MASEAERNQRINETYGAAVPYLKCRKPCACQCHVNGADCGDCNVSRAELQRLRSWASAPLIATAVAAEREACAKIADWAEGQCLRHARHPTMHCEEPECCEQRSMAKACKNIADAIRARGGE